MGVVKWRGVGSGCGEVGQVRNGCGGVGVVKWRGVVMVEWK